MKYELTDETRVIAGVTVTRIRALRDIGILVTAGDLGGWVEGEHNLSTYGHCWISGDAAVYGNAYITGNARIAERAIVHGNAYVSGSAQVYGSARVYGDARINGRARVYGHATVFGNATVYDNARVYDNAAIYGNASVYNDTVVAGDTVIHVANCERCHIDRDTAGSITTLRGSHICAECAGRYYGQCENCDGWNRDSDSCYNGCSINDSSDDDSDDDDGGCQCGCQDRSDDGHDNLLEDYNFKPYPIFHGTGPLFLGFELEVEGASLRAITTAKDHLDTVGYLKSDSSLSDGFEIVTHPMSYAWAMEHFPWEMLQALKNADCSAEESCGMHVHASRAGFSSTCHVYRWLKFIYRNQGQVEILARRKSTGYASFRPSERERIGAFAKGEKSWNRNAAVNVNPEDTFEVRVFASSLEADEVKAALSFVAASIEYTRELTSNKVLKGDGWTWQAFVDWHADKPQYICPTERVPLCVS